MATTLYSPWYSTSNVYIRYRISATINSQDIVANKSNVTVKVFFQRTNQGYVTAGHGSIKVTINGTQYTSAITTDQEITSTGINLFSRTVTITHNDDGKKSLPVSCSFTHSRFSASSVSTSFTLPEIKRATLPVIPQTVTVIGGTISIDTSGRAMDTYTHNLSWSIGEIQNSTAGLAQATGVTTGTTFTIPLAVADQIKNAESDNVRLSCTTLSGSTQLGTVTIDVPVSVPDTPGYNPTISTVAITNADEIPVTTFAQDRSRLSVAITAAGAKVTGETDYNSQLTAVSVSVGDQLIAQPITPRIDAGTVTIETEVLRTSGQLPVVVTVTDSRGRIATKTQTITVWPYAPPTLTGLEIKHTNAAGDDASDGSWLRISFDATVASCGGENAKLYTVKYRPYSSETDITLKSGAALPSYDAHVDYLTHSDHPDVLFSASLTWMITVIVYDAFGSTAAQTMRVDVEEVFMNWKGDGSGISFGEASEHGGMNVINSWPFYTHGMEIIPLIQSLIPPFPDFLSKFKAGRVSITPQAQQATSHHVTFDQPFDHVPQVMVTPVTSVPYTIVRYVTVNNVAVDGFDIVLYRENATSTGVMWFAVDLAVDDPIMIEIPDITQDEQTGVLYISGTREIEQGSETEPVVEQDEQTGIVSIT